MKYLRTFMLALMLTGAVTATIGCAAINKRATDACGSTGPKKGNTCKACCKQNGATGHSETGGDCTCRGG